VDPSNVRAGLVPIVERTEQLFEEIGVLVRSMRDLIRGSQIAESRGRDLARLLGVQFAPRTLGIDDARRVFKNAAKVGLRASGLDEPFRFWVEL
jgi:hypothetical protein